MKYVENQNAYWIMIILLVAMLFPVAIVVFSSEGIPEDSSMAAGIVLGTCLLVAMMFYRMKTEVSAQDIRISFGFGVIKKTISIKEIESITQVRNKWYYGWGIRLIPKGWMWNIYGLDAVELSFKGKKKVFRIGSQDAKKLKEKIEENLTHQSPITTHDNIRRYF